MVLPKLVQAPQNKVELVSIHCMINYLSKFAPNFPRILGEKVTADVYTFVVGAAPGCFWKVKSVITKSPWKFLSDYGSSNLPDPKW